jgi:hypothetical protein
VILVSLHVLGLVEAKYSLKLLQMTYELSGEDASQLIDAINNALADERKMMQTVQIGRANNHARVQFSVDATNADHQKLLLRLRQIPVATRVECLGSLETE